MFAGIEQRMKGGLQRLQQAVGTGLSMIIRGPQDGNVHIQASPGQSITIEALNALLAAGGSVTLQAADSAVSGAGGAINIQAGATKNTASTVGGTINITGGQMNLGNAGYIGGPVNITGGHAGPTAGDTGGLVTIKGGPAGTNGGRGGNVLVEGGTAGANTGGNVVVRPGAGTGSGRANIQLDGGRGGALPTNATGGFVTVPTCAGAPSGVPTSGDVPTGSVAHVIDTTNLRAYYYIAGTWRYAQLT
jgi:hypothetical protein